MQQVITACGAVFQAIQQGPKQALILFADPKSRSTLAVPDQNFLAKRFPANYWRAEIGSNPPERISITSSTSLWLLLAIPSNCCGISLNALQWALQVSLC